MLDLLRRQLDKEINKIRNHASSVRPRKGWIRTIREALGLTRAQMSKRLKVTPQAIEDLERSEAGNTITLKSLQQAATALDCRLFYILIPKENLEKTVDTQIHKKAKKIVQNVSHSMGLEMQATSATEIKNQTKKMEEDIKKRKNISLIWDDYQ